MQNSPRCDELWAQQRAQTAQSSRNSSDAPGNHTGTIECVPSSRPSTLEVDATTPTPLLLHCAAGTTICPTTKVQNEKSGRYNAYTPVALYHRHISMPHHQGAAQKEVGSSTPTPLWPFANWWKPVGANWHQQDNDKSGMYLCGCLLWLPAAIDLFQFISCCLGPQLGKTHHSSAALNPNNTYPDKTGN